MPNRKLHPEPFTQLPHWIWKEQIKPFAKIMLFAVYRWTAGFHRNSWKISDSEITEMTGIKSVGRVREYLEERNYFKCKREGGKSVIYTIPPPYRFKHTPEIYEGVPFTDSKGLRGAKDNIKEKFKESTLSDDLVVEMKSKYPDIDVNAVKNKMVNYYNGRSVPLGYKFREWCKNERPSVNGARASYKLDTSGFPMAYCEKCSISESYRYEDLNGDSKCCNAKLLPTKP